MPRKPRSEQPVDFWSLEPEFRRWIDAQIERSLERHIDALVGRAIQYRDESERSDRAHAARMSMREIDVIRAAEDLVELRSIRRNFTRVDEDFYRRTWEAEREQAASYPAAPVRVRD